jgi:hypothetical protein
MLMDMGSTNNSWFAPTILLSINPLGFPTKCSFETSGIRFLFRFFWCISLPYVLRQFRLFVTTSINIVVKFIDPVSR